MRKFWIVLVIALIATGGAVAYYSTELEITGGGKIEGEDVIIVDKPPIIIDKNISNDLYINQASDFDPLRLIEAYDEIDGDVTDSLTYVTDLDTSVVGDYSITYTASDLAGNTSTYVRIMRVWSFKEIETGHYHTLALGSNGDVYSWGYGLSGALGHGSTTNISKPKKIAALSDIIDIAVGNQCSFAIDEQGRLWSWGEGLYYATGLNSTGDTQTPQLIGLSPDGERYASVSAFSYTAGALTESGKVYTWGYNNTATTGHGDRINKTVPTLVESLPPIKFLTFGYSNGCAIDLDGNTWIWGSNNNGNMAQGVAGANTALGLVANHNPPMIATSIVNAVYVDFGYEHGAYINANGNLYTWGQNNSGCLGNGDKKDVYTPYRVTNISNASVVKCNYANTLILTKDGKVYGTGSNNFGQAGTGKENTQGQIRTPTISQTFAENPVAIAMGYETGYVLTNASNVWSFGYNKSNQFGNGSSGNSVVAVKWVFETP